MPSLSAISWYVKPFMYKRRISSCRGENVSDIVPSISIAGEVSGNTFSPARVRLITLISSSVPWSLYHRLSAAPVFARSNTCGSTSEVTITILIFGKAFFIRFAAARPECLCCVCTSIRISCIEQLQFFSASKASRYTPTRRKISFDFSRSAKCF